MTTRKRWTGLMPRAAIALVVAGTLGMISVQPAAADNDDWNGHGRYHRGYVYSYPRPYNSGTVYLYGGTRYYAPPPVYYVPPPPVYYVPPPRAYYAPPPPVYYGPPSLSFGVTVPLNGR